MKRINEAGRIERSESRQYLTIIVCMVCLMPLPGQAQKCIFYAIPGEVMLSIDNNTSQEEAAMVLAGYADQGLRLAAITSETLLISLDDRGGMDTKWLRDNPYVTRVRKTYDHVSVLFDSRVTDKYALDFILANTAARIQYITRRNPRKARVTVPAGQEQVWSNKLSRLRFIRDAEPVCASRYRATCEQYRGIIETSARDGEICHLPEPDVDWNSVRPEKRAECRRSGGSWSTSPDTCVDDCNFARDEFCWNRVTDYCDCGELKCWYKNPLLRPGQPEQGTCIDNPDWFRRFDK